MHVCVFMYLCMLLCFYAFMFLCAVPTDLQSVVKRCSTYYRSKGFAIPSTCRCHSKGFAIQTTLLYRNRLDIPINTQAIILFYLLTYLLIYLLKSGGLQILFTTVAIFATVNAADCKSTETSGGYIS